MKIYDINRNYRALSTFTFNFSGQQNNEVTTDIKEDNLEVNDFCVDIEQADFFKNRLTKEQFLNSNLIISNLFNKKRESMFENFGSLCDMKINGKDYQIECFKELISGQERLIFGRLMDQANIQEQNELYDIKICGLKIPVGRDQSPDDTKLIFQIEANKAEFLIPLPETL